MSLTEITILIYIIIIIFRPLGIKLVFSNSELTSEYMKLSDNLYTPLETHHKTQPYIHAY